jgi:hypothetical protein
MQEEELLEIGARNLEWFADNFGELQRKYADKFVAVDHGEFIGADESLDKLLKAVRGKADLQTILMEFVPAKDRLFVV